MIRCGGGGDNKGLSSSICLWIGGVICCKNCVCLPILTLLLLLTTTISAAAAAGTTIAVAILADRLVVMSFSHNFSICIAAV